MSLVNDDGESYRLSERSDRAHLERQLSEDAGHKHLSQKHLAGSENFDVATDVNKRQNFQQHFNILHQDTPTPVYTQPESEYVSLTQANLIENRHEELSKSFIDAAVEEKDRIQWDVNTSAPRASAGHSLGRMIIEDNITGVNETGRKLSPELHDQYGLKHVTIKESGLMDQGGADYVGNSSLRHDNTKGSVLQTQSSLENRLEHDHKMIEKYSDHLNHDMKADRLTHKIQTVEEAYKVGKGLIKDGLNDNTESGSNVDRYRTAFRTAKKVNRRLRHTKDQRSLKNYTDDYTRVRDKMLKNQQFYQGEFKDYVKDKRGDRFKKDKRTSRLKFRNEKETEKELIEEVKDIKDGRYIGYVSDRKKENVGERKSSYKLGSSYKSENLGENKRSQPIGTSSGQSSSSKKKESVAKKKQKRALIKKRNRSIFRETNEEITLSTMIADFFLRRHKKKTEKMVAKSLKNALLVILGPSVGIVAFIMLIVVFFIIILFLFITSFTAAFTSPNDATTLTNTSVGMQTHVAEAQYYYTDSEGIEEYRKKLFEEVFPSLYPDIMSHLHDVDDIDEWEWNVPSDYTWSPMALAAYFSAKYHTYDAADVESETEEFYKKWFVEEVELRVERRSRVVNGILEEYDYYIATLNVTKNDLTEIITEAAELLPDKNQYYMYLESNNGQQDYGPIMQQDWTSLVTSGFGPRNAPKTNLGQGSSWHKGVDIGVPVGTKLYSPYNGTVTKVANNPSGYGLYVDVTDENGWTIRYGHLSNNSVVSEGTKVLRGQCVAISGNTGNSSGPHVHVEVIDPDGEKYDMRYFVPSTSNIVEP